jgi:drug/metabolite transporter (DMT)-like permease
MALSFSITGAFIKGVHGIPEQEEVFYRNIIVFITSIVMILKSRAPAFGKKENRLALIGRGAFGTLGAFASYYAITHMILPNAVIISNLCPFLIFGQLPHHIQYIGYVLIIIGAIMLYAFNNKKQLPIEDNEVVIN